MVLQDRATDIGLLRGLRGEIAGGEGEMIAHFAEVWVSCRCFSDDCEMAVMLIFGLIILAGAFPDGPNW